MLDKELNNVLSLLKEATNLSFDGERYVLPQSDRLILQKYSIPYEDYGSMLRIQFKNHFGSYNLKYEKTLYSEIKAKDILSDFLVLDGRGCFIKFNHSSGAITCIGKPDKELLLKVENLIAYYQLFNFFSSSTFCDYYNDANNEIVIYSSVNGIFKIRFDTIPNIPFRHSIKDCVQQMIQLAKPLEIAPFFKNAIFKVFNKNGNIPLSEIIGQWDSVCLITKRDYELVSKMFDFEKFKDSLYKEKEKYFASIREVINKIFAQAVGIPISISATVFATYKVADAHFMMVIVLLAFVVYVIFYLKIQLIYRKELIELKGDFIREFMLIRLNSGLDGSVVNAEGTKISTKLKNSVSVVNWLIGTVIVLGMLVFFFIILQLIEIKFIWFWIQLFLEFIL